MRWGCPGSWEKYRIGEGGDFWSSQACACPSGWSEAPQGTCISSSLLETHDTVIKVYMSTNADEAQARRGWRLNWDVSLLLLTLLRIAWGCLEAPGTMPGTQQNPSHMF